jgi:hypothetical protein
VNKEILVSDLVAEGRIIDAISRAKIKITLCEWVFVPQLDEWQLVIATPLYDTLGPGEATRKIIAVLAKDGVYRDVPMRRITIRSPNDSLVKSLENEKASPIEGVLHVSKYMPSEYSVIFTPFRGPGGAVPARRFRTETELTDFLAKVVKVSDFSVGRAVSELHVSNSAFIPNVLLTTRRLKHLGLV